MAFISDLNPAIPTDDDLLDSLDVEITGIKQTLQDQFPNFDAAAVNATPAELDLLVGVPADLEHMGNKGSANGYCPLDASSDVPLANIPDTLTGKDADTLDGWEGNEFALLAGASFSGDVNLLSGDLTVESGDLVVSVGDVLATAGTFKANHLNKAFESLEYPLIASLPTSHGDDYVIMGGQRGTSSDPAADFTPLINFQQNIRPNQESPTTGTGFGYLFQTHRYGSNDPSDGDQKALYNLTSLIRSYATSGTAGFHDIVAVAGIAKAEAPSKCRAFGLYGDAAVYNNDSVAVSCELDVRNTTGGEAPATLAFAGSSIGLAIAGLVGTGLAPGSLYNTYGLLFQGASDAGFKRGITYDPTSIAPNGVALDFTRLTNSGVVPILLKNGAGIYMHDTGGTPIEIVKLNASDNLVLRTKSEIRFAETNVPSTLGTWVGSNMHLVVGSSTDDTVNMLQVHGPIATVGVFPLKVNSVQVVGTRKTGWTAATGTATRTTFATSTVTTAQLAERVKALIDDLITHGMIGT